MRESEKMTAERVPMSARLEAIVEFAGQGDTVCDVGCDHAHVPIRLLQTGCYRRAICVDVIDGPLGKAAGNLSLYGMQDRVELRLSDGMDMLLPGEADTLVITGMGGSLIEDIILREPAKPASFRRLVLGPQSGPARVRAALRRLGFTIRNEKLVCEDAKYYPVIQAEPCEKKHPEASGAAVFAGGIPDDIRLEAEDMFGPVLLRRRDPVLFEFLTRRTAAMEKILHAVIQAAQDAGDRHLERRHEIEHSLAVFHAALKTYDMPPWREV